MLILGTQVGPRNQHTIVFKKSLPIISFFPAVQAVWCQLCRAGPSRHTSTGRRMGFPCPFVPGASPVIFQLSPPKYQFYEGLTHGCFPDYCKQLLCNHLAGTRLSPVQAGVRAATATSGSHCLVVPWDKKSPRLLLLNL